MTLKIAIVLAVILTALLSFLFVPAMHSAYERIMAPGYSTCGKCNRPWKYIESHSTSYGKMFGPKQDMRSAMFPLCEKCWISLKTPQARLPYYRELWLSWNEDNEHHASWEYIKIAVLLER